MATHLDPRLGLIPNAFCPRIVVFSSNEADEACRRNRLPDFAALLRPFQFIDKVTVRHSNYATIVRPSFPLSFLPADRLRAEVAETGREDDSVWLDRSINAILTPERLAAWLSESSYTPLPKTSGPFKLKYEQEWIDQGSGRSGESQVASAPWYIAFLNAVLGRRLPTVFDTTSHPLAALLVVSTNDPEPLNEFGTLYDASNKGGSGWPAVPWLDIEPVLRYYVLLHETSDEPDGGRGAAAELLEAVSRAYGIHCALVCVNSEKSDYLRRQRTLNTDPHFKYDHSGPAQQPTVDHWEPFKAEFGISSSSTEGGRFGELMASEDVLGLKVFLRDFTIKSLIPHMERCVQHWNESLAASRKGITGRLFSVGRKYFASTNKSSEAMSSSAYNPTMRWYPYQSTEFQTRRLADWAFILADYKLASQIYDYIRHDSQADKAWTYFVSATHMIGLCGLLQIGHRSVRFDPYAYLFEPTAQAQMGVFDTLRMTLIYNEVAKSIGDGYAMASALLRTAALVSTLPDVEDTKSLRWLYSSTMRWQRFCTRRQ
ncbi:hypothetical protein CROQUDRAFT_41977 [Cronartium quercuum f. sp. fusiforme G11]|uniref:Uncharacterized protein n=1 Tax=Cronartium quercuum f. sp. fusiforme G11 TaxID=708437 RepID=A0A9P6NPS7_9BASI|nr:hypothetical protein CROQUDRAFT_41977 [Cronartium quercuum f. sp. fusiforme G11]